MKEHKNKGAMGILSLFLGVDHRLGVLAWHNGRVDPQPMGLRPDCPATGGVDGRIAVGDVHIHKSVVSRGVPRRSEGAGGNHRPDHAGAGGAGRLMYEKMHSGNVL